MSDYLPSSCPKRLFSSFYLFLLLAFPAFANNDPTTPSTTSAELTQLREFIAGYAQNFVGIEYVHGGHSTRQGFDCSGFTSFALQEFGIQVSPASSAQAQQGQEVSLDAVQPGDLVFFKRKGRIAHVAMVVRRTEEGGIICVHSTSSRGVMVEDIMASSDWRPKIMFARDVITQQALEKRLLPSAAQMEQVIAAATEEEMTPECAEEFEKNCHSIAPLEMLELPDLQAQFADALAAND